MSGFRLGLLVSGSRVSPRFTTRSRPRRTATELLVVLTLFLSSFPALGEAKDGSADSTSETASENTSNAPSSHIALGKWKFRFSGELTNYFIRQTHSYFGEERRSWLETSARLGAIVRHDEISLELGGLAVKTTGDDAFGTGTVPTGAPPTTPAPGRSPALYLDRAYIQLARLGSLPLQVTVGRQPIMLGSGFLIGDGVYDGFANSVRQAVYHNPRSGFDALRLRWRLKDTAFDGFVYRVHPSWDAGGDKDGLLGGLEVSQSFAGESRTVALGQFYRHSPSGLDNDMAIFDARAEQFFGTRKLFRAGGEFVWEFAGSCRNAFYCTAIGQHMNENAWHVEFRYEAENMRLKPFAEVGYVYYSHDFTPIATGFSDWGKWYLGNQVDWIIFGTDSKIVRSEAGFWPASTVKLRLQYHNTRLADPPNGAKGSLANEFSLITEWYPVSKLWFNLLLGDSRPGAALPASGLGNPFAGLNSGAVSMGSQKSFDLVFGSGIRF